MINETFDKRLARVVLTTVATEAEAVSLARSLVEEGFAACVQVLPEMQSIYMWEGKLETNRERLLLIKTFADVFDKLAHRLRELHGYDLPEIMALNATAVEENYLRWMKQAVR